MYVPAKSFTLSDTVIDTDLLLDQKWMVAGLQLQLHGCCWCFLGLPTLGFLAGRSGLIQGLAAASSAVSTVKNMWSLPPFVCNGCLIEAKILRLDGSVTYLEDCFKSNKFGQEPKWHRTKSTGSPDRVHGFFPGLTMKQILQTFWIVQKSDWSSDFCELCYTNWEDLWFTLY